MADVIEQPTGTRERRVGRWTWLTGLGLAMIGLAPFMLVAAALIWGLEVADELPLFVTLFVVPWIGVFLVRRFGTWAKVLAIVIAVLAALMMFWTAFGLAVPTSFFDFVPGVLVVPGVVITITGAVASIVARRRGHVGTRAEGGERRAIALIVGVVAVLAVVSAVLTVSSYESVDATEAAAEVNLKRFEYEQEAYSVPGGSQIVVRNRDPFLHTFTIDALGIDVELGPNSQALVDVPAEPGTYVVYCRPHTSDPEEPTDTDMASRLTIG